MEVTVRRSLAFDSMDDDADGLPSHSPYRNGDANRSILESLADTSNSIREGCVLMQLVTSHRADSTRRVLGVFPRVHLWPEFFEEFDPGQPDRVMNRCRARLLAIGER